MKKAFLTSKGRVLEIFMDIPNALLIKILGGVANLGVAFFSGVQVHLVLKWSVYVS